MQICESDRNLDDRECSGLSGLFELDYVLHNLDTDEVHADLIRFDEADDGCLKIDAALLSLFVHEHDNDLLPLLHSFFVALSGLRPSCLPRLIV